MRIRHGTPRDAGMLAELGARTFRDAFGADNTPENMALYLARSYGEPQQSAELSNPAMSTLLAEVDRQIAGYAQLRAGNPPACVHGAASIELWRFYVDRPWQGRGVAQTLMQAVRDEAIRREAGTLWLAVWERNERAKAFYRKCGFLDVGAQVFILGTDRQQDRIMAQPIGDLTPEPWS